MFRKKFQRTLPRQRRAFFASDGFGQGIPTKRTGKLQAAWIMRYVSNGDGTGYVRRYVDNVETLRGHCTTGDSADLVVTNYSGNGNQVFGNVAQGRSFITKPTIGLLGTGANWPCTFFKYRFWGPP